MQVVVAVVHPCDPLRLGHDAPNTSIPSITLAPVVDVQFPAFPVDAVVRLDGVPPDANVPLEREGRRVEQDEDEEEDFDCDRASALSLQT